VPPFNAPDPTSLESPAGFHVCGIGTAVGQRCFASAVGAARITRHDADIAAIKAFIHQLTHDAFGFIAIVHQTYYCFCHDFPAVEFSRVPDRRLHG
jgi:hypothetical protein